MKVYILTYNDLGFNGIRSIYGVYSNEKAAKQDLEDNFSDLPEECEPEVEEHEVY